MRKFIYSLFFISFALLTYINLTGYSTGIAGRTKKNGNEVGCVCHGLIPDTRVSVNLSGPSDVSKEDTVTYTLRFTGGPDVAGGTNISTSLGSLLTIPLDTELRLEEEFPGSGFELVHNFPKVFTEDTLTYTFKYIAPSTSNVIDTIFANVNSVNFNFLSSGDQWNYADNFIINIVDAPLPVELSSFNSTVINNHVILNWSTTLEINNSGFNVERSKLNYEQTPEWQTAGFVEGSGTSSVPVNYSYSDRNLIPGKYKYRLKQIDFNGNYEYHNLSNEVEIGLPSGFYLSQNYPNPFNPNTVIRYSLSENRFATLKVFDALGKEVATLVNEKQNAGTYEVDFDGSSFSSGIYFYTLSTADFTDTRKMFLLK